MSRVTSKYQATVPADVRAALGVKAGDRLGWEVVDGVVRVSLVEPGDPLNMRLAAAVDSKIFAEWLSDEDEEAFRDL